MSGLVAIVSHDRAAAVPEPEIDGLARAYAELRGGAVGEHVTVGAHTHLVTFGSQGLAAPPVRRRLGSWAAVVGSVHHGGELPGASLDELDGQFALVSYDEGAARVTVAVDRQGLQTLYVASRGARTYVSTSSLALARHLQATPSDLDLTLFLLTGMQFGATTPWEGIERLTAAEYVAFSDAAVERGTYWRPSIDRELLGLSREEAVERTIAVATETFRSHVTDRGPVWSDLTGGFDSRLLNVLLEAGGADFATATFGHPEGDEARLAGAVAGVAGWPWTLFDYPADWPDRLLAGLPRALGWSDGTLPALQLTRVLQVHDAQRRDRTRVLNGGGGEHMKGVTWRHEPFTAGRTTKVNLERYIDVRIFTPVPVSVFTADPRPRAREELTRRMGQWLEPYAAMPNTAQLDILHDLKSTGRFGAFRSAAQASVAQELPFYYRAVHQTVFSISPRHRSQGGLSRQVMRRLAPEVARVPTTAGGPAEPFELRSAHRFWPYVSTTGRNVANKVGHRVLGRAPFPGAARPNPTVAAARSLVLDAMADGSVPLSARTMRTGHLYSPGALDDLFARARGESFGGEGILDRILTVELAVRTAAGEPLLTAR